MIPKKIHYCWFGGNSLTDEAQKYINTWRKFCPEYEIVEWNESNFDVKENAYCREAYEAGKWAFVTDYVRLKVLYEYGGIYMDTDVEVCKNLDELLEYNAVSGYESEKYIPTGTMAACAGNEWIETLLMDYENRHFLKDDGKFDLTTNVVAITNITKEKYNIKLDGKKKTFGNNICLLPFEYLCAKSYDSGKVMITNKTYTVHHFAGSWQDEELKEYHDCYMKLSYIPISQIRSKFAIALTVFKKRGWNGLYQKIIERFGDN